MKTYIRGKIKYYNKLSKEIEFHAKNKDFSSNPDLIVSAKFQLVAMDYMGNKETIFKDDPRYLAGELIPANTKHIFNCPIHGLIKIENQKRINQAQIANEYKIWCPKCREYYLSDDFIPVEEDINYCRESLKNIHFVSSKQQSEKYFKKYMPQFFKIIDSFEFKNNEINNKLRFSDKIYFVKNNINEIPKCSIKNCNNDVDLLDSPSSYGFTIQCKEHKYHNFSSTGENELCEFIQENYSGIIHKNYRHFGNKELDIYLPELNAGFEFNGIYWHGEKFKSKNEHIDKLNYFVKNNISLFTVWEDDWIYKKSIIKSMIKNKLGITNNKIYARKCSISTVNNKDKHQFLSENHLQGNCPSSINIGLYYNENLVSLMTFGKKRKILNSKSGKNEFELLRFCNKIETTTIGGASKLFKYFISNYTVNSIISYANRDISDGNLYKKLDFEFIAYTKPNYWWAKGNKKYHRSNFMKHKLVAEGHDINKTGDEIMAEMGFWKIWGNGSLKYEWR